VKIYSIGIQIAIFLHNMQDNNGVLFFLSKEKKVSIIKPEMLASE
jgi:hypothetical protein